MTSIGILVIKTETLITDRAMRLSISAIQVIIAAMLYVLCYIIYNIIQILHSSNTSRFTQLGLRQNVQRIGREKSLESMSVPHTSPRDQHTHELEANTSTPPDSSNPREQQDQVKTTSSIPVEVATTLSHNAQCMNEGSVHTSHRSISDMNLNDTESSIHSFEHEFNSIVFPSNTDLNRYILRIHLVGFALWQTFICFDCTARDIDLSFIAGLIAGWYWQYARAERQSCVRLCTAFIFAATMSVVVLTEENIYVHWQDHISRQSSAWTLVHAYLSACFLPFATGVFWNIATPIKYSNIILDTKRSIVTFLLITVTFPIYWTALDINVLINFLANLPHISILCVLVLSPVFKFISIYIMLISLKKNQAFDMVLALVVVLCVSSWIVADSIYEILVIRTCLVLIMVIAHVINLQCTCCASLLGLDSAHNQLPC